MGIFNKLQTTKTEAKNESGEYPALVELLRKNDETTKQTAGLLTKINSKLQSIYHYQHEVDDTDKKQEKPNVKSDSALNRLYLQIQKNDENNIMLNKIFNHLNQII